MGRGERERKKEILLGGRQSRLNNSRPWSGEMSELEKVATVKPEKLSLIPRAHKEEYQLQQVL